jgi:hypothetical protein
MADALILRSNPIEVCFDAFNDLARLLLSILLGQPLAGKFTPLAVVASIFLVTQWQHIGWHSTGAIGGNDGYPMIGCYRVPESSRTPANSTATTPVFKAALPILRGKFIRQIALPSSPTMCNGIAYCLIMFGVFFALLSVVLATSVRVFLTFSDAALTYLFRISLFPFCRTFSHLAGMFFVPCRTYLASSVWMFFVPLNHIRFCALLTHVAQIVLILLAPMEVFRSAWEHLLAFRAALHRGIRHLKGSLCGLVVRSVDRLTRQAVRTNDQLALVHAFILPRMSHKCDGEL